MKDAKSAVGEDKKIKKGEETNNTTGNQNVFEEG
jgi:hypothetical protein